MSRWVVVRMPYVTEVVLVHLDLSDVGGVVGCVDFVLLLVIVLPIQALREGKEKRRHNGEFSFFVIRKRTLNSCLRTDKHDLNSATAQ